MDDHLTEPDTRNSTTIHHIFFETSILDQWMHCLEYYTLPSVTFSRL